MTFTTITLNPCLDRREYLETLTYGGLNRPYKTTVSAGGKGINVSKELIQLLEEFGGLAKTRVHTITFAGGKTGEVFKEQLFRLFHEATKGITVLPSSFDTRVCTKLLTPSGVTEINEEGRLCEDEIKRLIDAVADLVADPNPQLVFLCGSIPQGVDKNVYNFLITLLGECGIPVIVDTAGEGLVESLVASPSLIKPNESELCELCGHPLTSEKELVDFCRNLYVDNNTEIVCTLGEKGALYVGKEGVFKVLSQKISPCDSTGAGDAFLAAFAFWRYGEKKSAEEALTLANEYVAKKLKNSIYLQ